MVVALFGQFLPKLLPPKLCVELVDAVGTKQLVQVMMTGGALSVPAYKMWTRYYRIQVSNRRRWAKAHNVQEPTDRGHRGSRRRFASSSQGA